MRWRIGLSSRNAAQVARAAERYARSLGMAALRATDQAALAAQREIRFQMANQRLGKLGKVVRHISDLRNRVSPAQFRTAGKWRAGAAVFTRFRSEREAGAWDAYTTGPTIVPRRGKWLAIPTAFAPRRVKRRKITPANYAEAGLDSRIGPLKFVPGSNPGVAFLIVDDVRVGESGRVKYRKRTGRDSGQRRAFVIMFILIRRTRRSIRFRPEQIVERSARQVPKLINANLDRRPSGTGRGTVGGPVLFSVGGRFRQ